MDQLRLLNKYEEVTYGKLVNAVEADAHVFAKVRLADVFKISDSGISRNEYSYCLKAHFDFLVTDKDYMPVFSVEYDGKWHKENSAQVANDKLKDQLCEKFEHPLLRINSNYINREYKGIDLLTYFIDVWFLEKAFYEAQSKGVVPADEDFDACLILDDGKGRKWPYWISSGVQVKIQQHYLNNRINQMAPSHWIGKDDEGNYKCIAWVEVSEGDVVFVKTGMRKQLFQAVQISDLLSMLAIFDIDRKIDEHLAGRAVSVDKSSFLEQLQSFCKNLKPAQSFTAGSISYPVF